MKVNKHTPVFVTGIERSGSSIIAKIIAICGAWKGDTTGMYENIKIRELLKGIYKNCNADELGQYPLPDLKKIRPLYKDQINIILEQQRYNENTIWMYKSFRLIQTWTLWRELYPDAKWVIIRRRTSDIVDSCLKTGFMKAFEDPKIQKEIGVDNARDGWLWWIHYHEKLFYDLEQSGANIKVIWPERMVQGDYKQIYEMIDWLGLKWSSEIVRQIEPMLWKSKIKGKEK
jgi:hypothetical protein